MASRSGKGKQRGHGEGALYYSQALGRWVGMLDLGVDPSGRRRRRKFTGVTRAGVQAQMRDARRELEEGRKLGSARETLADLLRDYLARGLPPTAKSPNTRESYRWAIEGHLIPSLGARKLKDLSPDDVDHFLRGEAAGGLAKTSLAHLHQVLKRALRWGERRGRVSRNVATLVDTPEGKRRQSKALTPEQARALLEAAAGDRLEALFVLGLCIPSRPGELTGLCWDCVDFENGVIHFRRALHRDQVTGALELAELKTVESRRSVEAPSLVMEALRRRKKAQAAERLQAGEAWREFSEHGLVFTSKQRGTRKMPGSPIDPSHLRRSLRRLAKGAGIEGTWTVYELRHSAISALSYAGIQLEDIADAAGHRNSKVTAVVYRHNLRPTITSARAPMEALYNQNEETR